MQRHVVDEAVIAEVLEQIAIARLGREPVVDLVAAAAIGLPGILYGILCYTISH